MARCFNSEINNIHKRRKHYMRERATGVTPRGSGIDVQKIRAKVQANPMSRRALDNLLYGKEK